MKNYKESRRALEVVKEKGDSLWRFGMELKAVAPWGGGKVIGWMLIGPNAALHSGLIQDHKLKCKCSKDNFFFRKILDRMMGGKYQGISFGGSGSFELFCPIRSHEMYRNYIM